MAATKRGNFLCMCHTLLQLNWVFNWITSRLLIFHKWNAKLPCTTVEAFLKDIHLGSCPTQPAAVAISQRLINVTDICQLEFHNLRRRRSTAQHSAAQPNRPPTRPSESPNRRRQQCRHLQCHSPPTHPTPTPCRPYWTANISFNNKLTCNSNSAAYLAISQSKSVQCLLHSTESRTQRKI